MVFVDTSEALKFPWIGWKLVGIHPKEDYSILNVLHVLLIFLGVNVYSIVVFVTQLFYVTDLKYLLHNLPMNILVTGTALKFLIVLSMRRKILGINKSLAELDRHAVTTDQAAFLNNLIKFCHKLFIFGFICYEGVDIMSAVNAVFSKQKKLLYEIWLPYDWKTSDFRYWATLFYQLLAQTLLVLESLASDFSGPMYLMVLTAHLKNMMNRVHLLNSNHTCNKDDGLSTLKECIKDHKVVMEVFDVLQGTVSHIIFVQFASTALVLVMIALNYLLFSPNSAEVLALGFFVAAEILQILPCCFYSNEFMWATDLLVTSIYESNWYNQPQNVKKIVIIFMQMTQMKKVIVAGKIIPVTMASFASILKFSYSLLMVVIRIHN